jgi:hypothetical protein
MVIIAIASLSAATRTTIMTMGTTMTTTATIAGGADGIVAGCVRIIDPLAYPLPGANA